MNWLSTTTVTQFVVFTLLLTRLTGLVMFAPIYSSTDVPMRFRALLIVALALILAPTQFHVDVALPDTLVDFSLSLTTELLIGLSIGLSVLCLFLGIQLTGRIIGQMSGMAVAEVFDPSTDTSTPLFAQLLNMIAMLAFLLVGGHRLVMAALLDNLEILPLGSGFPPTAVDAVFVVLTQSFDLGLRAAAPATVALLLSTLVLGLIGRTMPQFNILMLGFGINSLVSMGTLFVSMGAIIWMFQDQLEPVLQTMFNALSLTDFNPANL